MKIELKEVSVRDLTDGYVDNQEEGVLGYSNRLDIRPAYQREFVYSQRQQISVIETVLKGFPLNIMYWVQKEDSNYEVLDGQQRTLSICEFVSGNFSIMQDENPKYFNGLTKEEKESILNYKLMIYFCNGKEKEKLDWFKTINIAGVKLTEQELRNAVYTGKWLSDAKSFLSKSSGAGVKLSKDYLNGDANRQEVLEKALYWISNGNVEQYMSEHQNDHDASDLRKYFRNLTNWIEETFIVKRKEMKGVDWGDLFSKFKDSTLNKNKLEDKISILMQDEEVQRKTGIYPYVLTNDEKFLNLVRVFKDVDKRAMFEKQKGICVKCVKPFKIEEMAADHIKPWSKGGRTIVENCQVLCQRCNATKSDRY
jgi:hypothetical protein